MTIWRFDAIGTGWEIEGALDDADREVVTAEVERFDREWSRFRADSEVTRLARDGGRLLSPDAAPMLDAYRELSEATAGAVNPLIGDSLSALGYDADYSLRATEPIAAPEAWTSIIDWGEEGVSASAPALLDVGALGKGRLVDLVFDLLADVPGELIVDGGGDLRARGGAVRTALEHPFDPTKAIGVVELQGGALCGSAINRRAWGEGLHHVLDARTGLPVRTWAATWALGTDAMSADAATTALFFDGGPALVDRWGLQWLRMSTDGVAERSRGWPGELFLAGTR